MGPPADSVDDPIDDQINQSRRDFLRQCCWGASAAFIPSRLHELTFPSLFAADPAHLVASNEFHLQPHYRSRRPLDDLMLKVKAGLDEFITEKYADQIAVIMNTWSVGLREASPDLKPIVAVLTQDFRGSSARSAAPRQIRSAPPVEVTAYKFPTDLSFNAAAFIAAVRESLNAFSRIITADFQITAITTDAQSPPLHFHTRIQYEFVGAGRDFHREQRVGNCDLEWETDSSGNFRLSSWQWLDETRSRAINPMFADITAQALGNNLSYASQLLRGTDYWRTVLDGASGIDIYGHNGVSVGDIDNDGFDDLYICQPAGLPNRLYRNRGDGTFEDITDSAGVGVLDNTACALFADIDNDGLQDLIVVRASGPLLFMNQGNGKFRAKPDAFQFATPPQGTFTGAAIADYDRDGWLDIYFCLYVYYQGADQYKYPAPYYDANNGPPNFLMRNQRDGTFRDATEETGLNKNNTRYSFCCAWNDYNHDAWPDLYVVNDFGRKNLYRNNRDGTFTDVAAEARVEDVGAGMSVSWLDYNHDGNDDLYVANMWTAAGERIASQEIFKKDQPEQVRALYQKHAMGNSLFQSSNPPWNPVSPVVKCFSNFKNETAHSGAGLGRWSWSSDAWDFDHDGYPDLYITNGMVSGPRPPDGSIEDLNSFFWRQVVAKSPGQPKPSHDYEQGWNAINELIRADGTWSGYERNVFYANNRDGTFSDISGAAGLDFIEDGRSFALVDFDHDGRQEVFVKNRNAPQLRIIKNEIADLPPSISFRLRGTKSNRDAIGAVIIIETSSGRQTRTLQAGSGFLSQHSKEIFFGLGTTKDAVKATICWPSGLTQELNDLPPNHRVWVEEGSTPSRVDPFKLRPASDSPEPELRQIRQISLAGLQPWSDAALPATIETWLLAPVSAPNFLLTDQSGHIRTLSKVHGNFVLLFFWTRQSQLCHDMLMDFERANARWSTRGPQLIALDIDPPPGPEAPMGASGIGYTFPIVRATEDVAAIYNILFRQLFDRHRDMPLPTSFLIDRAGDIVKTYQGRITAAQIDTDLAAIPTTTSERLKKALPFSGITEATDFTRNYLSYGSIFFQRGYYDQAGGAFARAAKDDPQSAEALYGLGSVYLNQQKLDEARAAFEHAVKLHASFPDTLANAWNNLGLLDARAGKTAEAIAYFQRALALSPDHVVALVNLASAYRQLHQYDDARRALDHALVVSPNDPEANYGAGMVAASTASTKDDTDRAEEYLLRALTSRPAYPEALNNLGILYLRTQRRNQAVARFEECIRVAPTFDQSYLNLARVYVIEGAPEKARALLEELLKQQPENREAEKMIQQLTK